MANKRRFRLGVDRFYAPPLSWVFDGAVHGVVGKLVSSLEQDLDLSFEIVALDQSALGAAIDSDALDCRFPDNPIWDFCSQKGHFSESVFDYADSFFIKKDVGLPERPILGALAEYPLPDIQALLQLEPEDILACDTIAELSLALYQQRAQILFGPELAFRHALAYSPHLPEMEKVEWLPTVVDSYHFAFSDNGLPLMDDVNAWLSSNREKIQQWDEWKIDPK